MEITIYAIQKSKLQIQFPDGGKWVRGFLKETLGARAKMDWSKDRNGVVWWEISRSHLELIIMALQHRYAGVWVIRDYSQKVICTSACQGAKADKCICSCGGKFHRGGGDWDFVIDEVLIGNEIKRVTRYYAGEGTR